MKFPLKKSAGMSLIEALGGLALLGIAIAGTISSAHYLYHLQYSIDIRTIDDHFGRIHRLLSYGNCDSFVGDELTSNYKNKKDKGLTQKMGNKIPEIKVHRSCVDSDTGELKKESECGFEVLYAVKNSVVRENEEPVKTFLDKYPHIYIKSMGLEKLNNSNYALLTVIFHSTRAKKTLLKSTRKQEELSNLNQANRGEIERSLKIYMETEGREIKACGINPVYCPVQSDKEVTLVASDNWGAQMTDCETGQNLSQAQDNNKKEFDLEKTLSGSFRKFEYKTDYCICKINFYCQEGVWHDNTICMKRNKGNIQ